MKKPNQQVTGTRAGTLTAKYDAHGDYSKTAGQQATTNKQATSKPTTKNIMTSQYDANQDYTQ